MIGADEAMYAVVMGVWGAGTVAANPVLAMLRRAPLTPLVAGGFVAIAVAMAGMGLATSVLMMCFFAFLGGIANGVELFASTTAIQEATDEEHQARVGGVTEALLCAGTGAGFLVGGLLASAMSPRLVYVLAAAGVLVAAAYVAMPRGLLARVALAAWAAPRSAPSTAR